MNIDLRFITKEKRRLGTWRVLCIQNKVIRPASQEAGLSTLKFPDAMLKTRK